MALGDYLTGNEWDACFYASMGQHHSDNFGESMQKTILYLLEKGYRFPGLTDNGNKKCQVENGVNAPKCLIWFGNPEGVDILAILDNGRQFLKNHASDLVDETDDEWKSQMNLAREDK